MSDNTGKSKYGAILSKARQSSPTEDQKDDKPDNQENSKTENQKTNKTETGKEVEPESQETVKQEKMVNVGAKVPLSHRNHWAAEAKRNGRPMTDVIISALTDAFGLPPEE